MKTLGLVMTGLVLSTQLFSQNVGIDILDPVFKLDVRNGSINVDSVYRIGTVTVLNAPGGANLFVGKLAGRINAGTYNTFAGDQAGYSNLNGYRNSFFGFAAGHNNTEGYQNSFFGESAGYYNSTGTANSFFGKSSGVNNTTGSGNSFFGSGSGEYSITGNFNSFFGAGAGQSGYNATGNNNSFFGWKSGSSITSGSYNSFFGHESGTSNTIAEDNSFFGHASGKMNTTGYSNSFVGRSAGEANTTGYSNSFFGRTAGYSNTTGFNNSFFGHDAGAFNTSGSINSFFGKTAGYNNTTGNYNSFFGYSAGSVNTIGNDNSFFGWEAGFANNSGSSNSFFGFFAGSSNTTGTYNTAVGKNTYVGSTLINVTAIGAGAIADDDDKVRIGDMIVGSIGGQVGWSTFSDGRFKKQVQEDIEGLAFIKKLRPVSYVVDLPALNNYYSNVRSPHSEETSSRISNNNTEIELRQTGFIAQEVEQVANELHFSFSGVDAPGNDGALYGLRYGDFVVPLVKSVQEQQVIIEKQGALIDELNKKMDLLVKEIAAMKEK